MFLFSLHSPAIVVLELLGYGQIQTPGIIITRSDDGILSSRVSSFMGTNDDKRTKNTPKTITDFQLNRFRCKRPYIIFLKSMFFSPKLELFNAILLTKIGLKLI